MLNDVGIAGRA